MRCCVIGGAGFIGTRLVRRLLQDGRDVVVLSRRSEPPADLPRAARYVSGGYGDRSSLRKILVEVDEVVDLAYATVPQTSFADPVFDILANLPATVGLLEEAAAANLRRVVMVSSGGTVYGPARQLPISEEHPTNPVSPYGITKLTIEKYALMFHRLRGVQAVIVRPANAYGAGQKPFTGQGFIATAMGHALRGDDVLVYGQAGTVRDYVHVDDVAGGIHAVLDHGRAGEVYNLGSGVGRNNLEVLEAIAPLAAAKGRALNIRHAPARGFDVEANVLDSSRARQACGWSPRVEFTAGLAEMWNDIASQGAW